MKAKLLYPLLLFLSIASLGYGQSNAPFLGGPGDGYSMSEILVNTTPTAIEDELERFIQVYPNPLKKGEELLIQSSGGEKLERIRLLDNKGSLLFERDLLHHDLRQSPFRIYTHGWPAGIYLLQFESEKSNFTKKIILL
ncbi:T9SS type A sorting domain-containing protein [Nafulsella turpanensis]|uniref:T9SS type A sorting domain-containing protein n=1 Tax=Nafulsella turpanensis TaxID=1265690 RepID=UPI00035D93F5|nr:T9SS type A sorting domain-containing protein [Nafulsella turpanensis]